MALQHRPRSNRLAFTLVEMLVAMALILFIMVILSEAFVAGLESFRQLKAIGDMEERLRAATIEIRRDLNADHFEGRRRLSDPNFWNVPVREGFFRIYQGAPTHFEEGKDSDNNPSFRAWTNRLHFTVKLRGNQLDKFFSTALTPLPQTTALASGGTTFFDQAADGRFQDIPTGSSVTYITPWAEVAYFLYRDPNDPKAGGVTDLYSLYRTQLLVTPDNRRLNWNLPGQANIFGSPIAYSNAAVVNAFKPLSCQPEDLTNPNASTLYFNNPSDLTQPFADMTTRKKPRRGVYDLLNPDVTRSTLLLSDVISFHVQILSTQGSANGTTPGGVDFMDLSQAPTVPANFDTGDPTASASSANTIRYNILAIQVTLRVWDAKTEQARQITIVQDM